MENKNLIEVSKKIWKVKSEIVVIISEIILSTTVFHIECLDYDLEMKNGM